MAIEVLLLLVSFGAGAYFGGRRGKSAASMAQRQVIALEQEGSELRQRIANAEWEEAQRLERVTQWRQNAEENDISNTKNQLKFVSQAELHRVRPVNKEASNVLYALNDWLKAHQRDWWLSFEVSMGAFIRTLYDEKDRAQRAAFSSYNSKRVDFLFTDQSGYPRLVIEYRGTGTNLSADAEDRMAVKRAALAKAGIPLLEIPAKTAKPEIWRLVTASLNPATTLPAG